MRRFFAVAILGLFAAPALAQDDLAALTRKARELEDKGQTDAAVKLFAQAVDRSAATAGPDSAAVGDVLDRYVATLLRTGRYADCVPVAERLLKIRTARAGGDAVQASGARNQLGLAYKLSGRVRDAIPLYEGTLTAFQKHKDLANTPVTAVVMHNLAAAYATAGRVADAERLYLDGLALAERVPSGDKFVPQGWHNLATFYSEEGRFAEADALFRKALAAKEKDPGPKDPNVAVTLNNLAGVLLASGDAAGAERFLTRALEIFKATSNEAHPHAIVARNMLAESYRGQGRAAEAEKQARATLQQLEKELGSGENARDGIAVAGCLVRLGHALKDQVKYKDAEAAARRAVALRERYLEPGHPDTVAAWSLLAGVLRASARMDEAEKLYRKAKSATDERFGKAHPKAAEAGRELAVCLAERGDFDAAEALLAEARKALAGNKKADPFASRRLDHATAELYRETGRYGDAEPLYVAAIKAAVEKFGPAHPLTTSWAYDASLFLVARERYKEAHQLLTAVLTGREKTLGKNHPATVATLELQGEVLEHLGQRAEAEAVVREALHRSGDTDPMVTVRLASNLALRSVWAGDAEKARAWSREAVAAVAKVEKLYPFDDPMCWLARHNAGFVSAATGDVRGSVTEYDAARRAVRRFLAEALPGLSEREQLFVLEKFDRFNLHAALNLGPAHATEPDVAVRTAEWVLNGKAVAHDALAAAARGTADRSPVRSTLNLRRQAAGIAITPPAAGRNRPADPWLSLHALQAAMPDGAILIDVVRLDKHRIALGKPTERQPARYVAWVTGNTGTTKVIDLGPAATIDAAVTTARKAMADAPAAIRAEGEPAAEKKLRQAASDLSRLVLEPLKAAAGSAKVWYVAPDGELWLYPWAALPTADGYLAEAVDVRYVTSGRDLLPRKSESASGDSVIVADPNFDAGTGRERVAPASPAGGRGVASLLGRVARLPGTAIEAQAVAPNLAVLAARKPKILTAEQASEEQLRQARRPRVLMLATHGFFLPPDPKHRAGRDDWFQSLTLPLTVGDEEVNPLRRSGLLLAGCNREPIPGNDDGVLTGLDVLELDLRGCELVVLSACETGLGEVRDGEGVGGLRQAFLAAGAERVMSTLWQVPDLESARLMARCFELQANGRPAASALREAQLEAVSRRREKYAAAHPFFWAAYTLTGGQDSPRR
ncbi:MAG TPA: CHAT domain-containing tetratricopeptide repeat protein [Gemmataceae bacterium]|nr:CHAT domain-containing tetratricopeptide repeat protein [Gemmataceae bacterium]